MAVAGFVKNDGLPAVSTDVFFEILDSGNNPVYYNSTTTDSSGFYMVVFTVPASFSNGSYTVQASTAQAVATQAINIIGSAATNSISYIGANPNGSISSSSPAELAKATTSLLLTFNVNVNFFVNKNATGWENTIIGLNENNQDCISVYEGTSTTPMSSNVNLVSDLTSGSQTVTYYDLSGTAKTTVRQNCLEVALNSALKDGTLYTVKIDKSLCANNGSTLGTDNYIYFKTPSAGGGGGSGGAPGTSTGTATVETAVDSSGKATANVSDDDVSKAIADAAVQAKENGTKPAVEVKVETDSAASSVETSLSSGAMDALESAGVDSLTVTSDVASVKFDGGCINKFADSSSSGNVTFSASKVDSSTLPADVQNTVGDHPVYRFTVTADGQPISELGGTATITIPYTPTQAEEDGQAIVVYYIRADGTVVTVTDCKYDPVTHTLTFTSDHFSTFAVGYNKVSFSDVSGWYTDYVSFLAARGIMNGKGGGLFMPDAQITRAEFARILYNLSGDTDSATASSFSDVKTTDWFFHAVEWAYSKGVVTGAAGVFNPMSPITRQDVAAILSRYAAKVAHFTLPKTDKAIEFTDSAKIAAYAKDAVAAIQQAGIISGRGDGTFAPTDNESRAEAAKMVAIFVREMIG